VDEQIELMIPEIREKLREMMTEKKKQGFRTSLFSSSVLFLTLCLFRLYPP
jgi:phosphoserine phosphatase